MHLLDRYKESTIFSSTFNDDLYTCIHLWFGVTLSPDLEITAIHQDRSKFRVSWMMIDISILVLLVLNLTSQFFPIEPPKLDQPRDQLPGCGHLGFGMVTC